jgi:hypothetical protein
MILAHPITLMSTGRRTPNKRLKLTPPVFCCKLSSVKRKAKYGGAA